MGNPQCKKTSSSKSTKSYVRCYTRYKIQDILLNQIHTVCIHSLAQSLLLVLTTVTGCVRGRVRVSVG